MRNDNDDVFFCVLTCTLFYIYRERERDRRQINCIEKQWNGMDSFRFRFNIHHFDKLNPTLTHRFRCCCCNIDSHQPSTTTAVANNIIHILI